MTILRFMFLGLILVSLGEAAVKVDLNGAAYPGFRVGPISSSFTLMGAEADITARVSSKTRDLATLAFQLWVPWMADWTMGFHYGQAYAMIPLGLRLPTVRVGQAVIPFGLLADYDTHGQLVQTQYARTVSQRIDLGAGFQGSFAHTAYSVWVSNGTGPYRADVDNNKVVSARVAPKLLLGDAELTVGLSGLAGRLPRWEIMDTMPMMAEPPASIMKYRAALDNTTDWGPLTLHLEAVAGKDSLLSQPLAYGYYAEGRYAFVSWFEVLAKYDGFHTPNQQERNVSAGLVFYPPKVSALDLQVVYERIYDDKLSDHMQSWDIAAQLAVRF